MNKNKLFFLCLISFISLFIGVNNAEAEEVTLYMECEYELVWSLEEWYNTTKKTDNKAMQYTYIAYTELSTADGNNYYIKFQPVYPTYGPYAWVNLYTDKDDAPFIGKAFGLFTLKKSSETRSTFTRAFANNNKRCPKFLTFEDENSTKEKEYIPKFSNDYSSYCKNSADESSNLCGAVYKLSKNITNVVVDTDEDIWHTGTSNEGNGECSGLDIDIRVKKSNDKYNLYVLPLYRLGETGFSGFTNWGYEKLVSDPYFIEIANFATGKPMSFYFNPDNNGKGETWFSFRDLGGNKCVLSISNGISTTKKCATKSDINFNNYNESKIDSIFSEVDKSIKSLTRGVDGVNDVNRIPIDASNMSKDTINSWNDKITNLQGINNSERDRIEQVLDSISNGTYKTVDGKTPCKTSKDRADELLNYLTEKTTLYEKNYEAAQKSVESIEKRMEILGFSEEETDKVQAEIDRIEGIRKEMQTFIRKVRVNLLANSQLKLDNVDTSGCGVLSPNMIDFLNTVLWYVRIGGVTLAAILSLVEYIKAAAGSEDKSMAAANKKFVTRLILVACLFLLPALLEFGLGILNISTTAGSLECLK